MHDFRGVGGGEGGIVTEHKYFDVPYNFYLKNSSF